MGTGILGMTAWNGERTETLNGERLERAEQYVEVKGGEQLADDCKKREKQNQGAR